MEEDGEIVAREAGEEREVREEATFQPTAGGRRRLEQVETATMEETDVVEEEVMTGEEVVETEEDLETTTLMTGPSLCPGMREWRRSSSTLVTVHPASTLRGLSTNLNQFQHVLEFLSSQV